MTGWNKARKRLVMMRICPISHPAVQRTLCAAVYCMFAFALTVQGLSFCLCPQGSMAAEAAYVPSDCCADESAEADYEGHVMAANAHVCNECVNFAIPDSGTDGFALGAAEFRAGNGKHLDSITLALNQATRVPGMPDPDAAASSAWPALTASTQPASASMPLILRL